MDNFRSASTAIPEAEQITHGRHHDMLDRRQINHLRQVTAKFSRMIRVVAPESFS